MDKSDQRYKTVQQIADGQEKKEPLRYAPRVYTENYRPSAHTRWHMEHRPYERRDKNGA